MAIGMLMLIPGAYQVRIADLTYRGLRGHVYAELEDPNELDM